MKASKKQVTTPSVGGKAASSYHASAAGSRVKGLNQDVSPTGNSILERVKAFVNLKFTPTIDELAFIKEPEDIKKVEGV